MDAIEHFAEDVKLFLIGCTVADADRLRVAIAAQMCQLHLLKVTLATNAVHDLQVFSVGVRETAQPVGEGAGLLGKAEHVEGVERERRVAQPCETIIPVAHTADMLRQRCGWGRDDSTGGSIGHHFQGQSTALNPVRIGSLVRTTGDPATPAVQCMGQFGVEVAAVKLFIGQPLCRLTVAPHADGEDQALTFTQ